MDSASAVRYPQVQTSTAQAVKSESGISLFEMASARVVSRLLPGVAGRLKRSGAAIAYAQQFQVRSDQHLKAASWLALGLGHATQL